VLIFKTLSQELMKISYAALVGHLRIHRHLQSSVHPESCHPWSVGLVCGENRRFGGCYGGPTLCHARHHRRQIGLKKWILNLIIK
jgi:hypothetical protein